MSDNGGEGSSVSSKRYSVREQVQSLNRVYSVESSIVSSVIFAPAFFEGASITICYSNKDHALNRGTSTEISLFFAGRTQQSKR